jgi:hypothetical protein
MTDSEVQFPIRCPICRQELLTAFRLSVVADGLENGDIRLYANCHVASWDATQSELEHIRRFLDGRCGEDSSFPALIAEREFDAALHEAGF